MRYFGLPGTYWMDGLPAYAQTILSMESKVVGEQDAELKTSEGGAWSTLEMIQRGFTLQALVRGRRRFQLAYWRDRFGGYHYPKWQFDQSMKVFPEVAEILALFRTHDTMRILTWFVRPVASKSKSLLDLIRSGRGGRAVAIVREEERQNASVGPLSKKDAAELRRRMKDLKDPTRYVIASCWTGKHVTFYDVQRGGYVLNEIAPFCLLRRREDAEAIVRALDRGKDRDFMRHQVVEARVTSRGPRLSGRLSDPRNPSKRIRPRLRVSSEKKAPLLVPISPPDTRGHILEGFLFACENRDALAAMVANAPSRLAAEKRLRAETLMSQAQAAAVLELRFWHFSRREYRKFLAEFRTFLRNHRTGSGRGN